MSRLMIGSRGLIWTVTLLIADRKHQMNQHEADELAKYKCSHEVELEATLEKMKILKMKSLNWELKAGNS